MRSSTAEALKVKSDITVDMIKYTTHASFAYALKAGMKSQSEKGKALRVHKIENVPDRGGRVDDIRIGEVKGAVRAANAYMKGTPPPSPGGRGRGRGRGRGE
mmetsp:Transcript_13254/g.34753  ORF Transcript_13254/g.34753 Transcript_13254/m.34753 type:complete len:102 (+) Transcript_13254:897-1202(+)